MSADLRIDVWWADLRQADLSLTGSLPPAERARVMALERPADRGRRLVAAALLQHAVAAVRRHEAGPPVKAWRPVEVDRTCAQCGRQHGRPVVAGGPHLSVAHSGVLVVVATCTAAMVGVDVEQAARFGGSVDRTLAWARDEAALKAGLAAADPSEAGPGGRSGGRSRVLRPPLAGYAAALWVASDAELAVTEHHVVLTGVTGR